MSEHDEIHADIIEPDTAPPAHWIKEEWNPADTLAEVISRTADLTRQGYCKWHGGSFSPGGHYNRIALIERGICEDCSNWRQLWLEREYPSHIVINRHHYIIGPSSAPIIDRGMGGARFVILRHYDRAPVITLNLWHQGEIPALWRKHLPENAIFLDGADNAAA